MNNPPPLTFRDLYGTLKLSPARGNSGSPKDVFLYLEREYLRGEQEAKVCFVLIVWVFSYCRIFLPLQRLISVSSFADPRRVARRVSRRAIFVSFAFPRHSSPRVLRVILTRGFPASF